MRLLKSAALLVVCGCAGLAAVNKRSPGSIANGTFTPALPAAANYGIDPARQCPTFGVNAEVASQLKEQSGGKAVPQPDGRLCELAETLLSWNPNETPSDSLLSFLSWHYGLPSPVRRVVITNVESADTRAVAAPLADGILAFAATASMPRYGLSTQRQQTPAMKPGSNIESPEKAGITKVVLLLQEGTLELDPLPRKLPP